MDIPLLLGRIRPGASWGWKGSYVAPDAGELSNLVWRDAVQVPPTQQELDDAWVEYQAEVAVEAGKQAAEEASISDINSRWSQYTALKGKTPAEIYDLMQTAMDNWTSLADARVDLRDWLPLMAAAIAWIVMREAHTE